MESVGLCLGPHYKNTTTLSNYDFINNIKIEDHGIISKAFLMMDGRRIPLTKEGQNWIFPYSFFPILFDDVYVTIINEIPHYNVIEFNIREIHYKEMMIRTLKDLPFHKKYIKV